MKRQYEDLNLKPDTLDMIGRADAICTEYARQGYDLTLRQLYYQLVARAVIPNTQQSYARLGDTVAKGRMAGLIDWAHIVDRTRSLRGTSHWENAPDIIEASAQSFHLDKWRGQPYRVEVWVEKEALAGVVERAAAERDINWFSCRGYTSLSEIYTAGRRLGRYVRGGQMVVVLHLGDHDPSGIDMTRDIEDRLRTFADLGSHQYGWLEIRRIALNMDQIEQYDPPPNPAKLTDSRASGYVEQFGYDSWELDALDPAVLHALILEHVDGIVDQGLYEEREAEEQLEIERLRSVSAGWDEIIARIESGDDDD